MFQFHKFRASTFFTTEIIKSQNSFNGVCQKLIETPMDHNL